jgi:uncharacterized membrane protein
MVDDKPSKTDEQTRFDILKFFMDFYGRYHNHKENMAWVATAFYVGGIAYIVNALRRLTCNDCSWRTTFTALVILAGVLALLFVCWQFKRRQEATKRVLDCYKQLLAKHNELATTDTKLDWTEGNTADPRETGWLSYIAIVGVTVVGLFLLNIC